MNTHGTTYLVIRSLVRGIVFLALTLGVFVGIPMAVHFIWPGLILSAVLWALVAWMYFSNQKRLAALEAEEAASVAS